MSIRNGFPFEFQQRLSNSKVFLHMLCFEAISSLIAFFFDPQSFHCQNVAPCLQAPPGCSQFHTEPQGTILSLNYLDKQYPLGTRLDVCIKKAPGACGVQYDLGKMGVGTTKTGGIGYGLVGSCLVPNFPISSTFIFARFVMTTLCSGERRPPCVAGGTAAQSLCRQEDLWASHSAPTGGRLIG